MGRMRIWATICKITLVFISAYPSVVYLDLAQLKFLAAWSNCCIL